MLSKLLVRNVIETSAITEYNKCYLLWLQYFCICLSLFLWKKEVRRRKRSNISEACSFLIEAVKQYHCCQSINSFVSEYLCILILWREKFTFEVLCLILVLEISACSSQSTARQRHTPSSVWKPFPHSL